MSTTPPGIIGHEVPDLAFHGRVETTTDALRLIYAAREGVIPRIRRRLNDSERRSMIKSGACFVFGVEESGIKRWTDGMLWSPSRIIQNYLVYREINERVNSRGSHRRTSDASLTLDSQGESRYALSTTNNRGADQEFKPGGLIKKTITVTVDNSDLHLISYYTAEDVRSGRLKRPTSRLDVMSLELPPQLFRGNNFRNPLKIEIGPDGRPRFTPDADETDKQQPGSHSNSRSRSSSSCKLEESAYDLHGDSPSWSSDNDSSNLYMESNSPIGGPFASRHSPDSSSSSSRGTPTLTNGSSSGSSSSTYNSHGEKNTHSTIFPLRSADRHWSLASSSQQDDGRPQDWLASASSSSESKYAMANEPHWSTTLGYNNTSSNAGTTGGHHSSYHSSHNGSRLIHSAGRSSSLHVVDAQHQHRPRQHHINNQLSPMMPTVQTKIEAVDDDLVLPAFNPPIFGSGGNSSISLSGSSSTHYSGQDHRPRLPWLTESNDSSSQTPRTGSAINGSSSDNHGGNNNNPFSSRSAYYDTVTSSPIMSSPSTATATSSAQSTSSSSSLNDQQQQLSYPPASLSQHHPSLTSYHSHQQQQQTQQHHGGSAYYGRGLKPEPAYYTVGGAGDGDRY